MGWLKAIFLGNSVEGQRESMLTVYKASIKAALNGRYMCQKEYIPVGAGNYNAVGLYGGSLYKIWMHGAKTRDLDNNPSLLWAELTPFLLMPSEVSIEALTEYVIYQETPERANLAWLRQMINEAMYSIYIPNEPLELWEFPPTSFALEIPWFHLLESEIQESIENFIADETHNNLDEETQTSQNRLVFGQITNTLWQKFVYTADREKLLECRQILHESGEEAASDYILNWESKRNVADY